MRAYGKADIIATDSTGVMVFRVGPADHDMFFQFIKSIKGAQARGEEAKINGTIGFIGELLDTEKGGKLVLKTSETTLDIEKNYRIHTRASQNTFYGVVRFITWCHIGHKPKSEDIYWDAEEIIETYAPRLQHPVTGEIRAIRPGDPRLTTKGMSLLIEGALNTLAHEDIDASVLDAIGPDMKKLWESWYDWRYNKGEDPLFEDEMNLSWDEYQERYPVCEFSGVGDSEYDPLERMHIVSGGSDIADYEESWNWIHARHSIHINIQHQNGWKEIFRQFPHMKGKILRAREIANKRGLL